VNKFTTISPTRWKKGHTQRKAKVIGKIGKVSSFLIGNSLKAKGYFAIFKYAISTIDKSSFV
jgi:hypothetical protein